MRMFREEGRVQDYKERIDPNRKEIDDWTSFRKKGKKYSEKLEVFKPDIVAKLNVEHRKKEKSRRKEMEEKRKNQIEGDGEEWIYNAEDDYHHFVGERDPIVHNDPEFEPLTEK